MIGSIALEGFRGFVTVDAGTSVDVFDAFVQEELVPNLKSGDIVVMDNLAAHESTRIVQRIREAGANVLFVPTYSSEFNPIERVRGELKDILRRRVTLTRHQLETALSDAINAITPSDIAGWTRLAGYALGAT